MKALGRIIAILIGLALIALIGSHIYFRINLDYTYINNLPSWLPRGNKLISAGILGLEIIVVLLVIFGGKKALRISLLPLFVVALDLAYKSRSELLNAYRTLITPDFFNALRSYGLVNLLRLAALGSVGLFYLTFFIVAVAGRAHKLGARIVLLLFGLLPLGFVIGAGIRSGVFVPGTANIFIQTPLGIFSISSDIIIIGTIYGIYALIGLTPFLALRDSERRHRKARTKKDAFDNPRLTLTQISK